MERSERLFQSILDSVSEGVITLDANWKILSWNSAAEKITGFLREEVLGKECEDIFQASLCRERCPVDKALLCGHPYQDVEVSVRNKSRRIIHLVVNAAPLYGDNGEIIGGLETFRDVSHRHWMQEELQHQYDYGNIVGRSDKIQAVFGMLSNLVDTDTTVLIQGESGTGKELIARALHYYGPRRNRSFVAINCSAIAEGMLESELFGHVKGAFTGAVSNHAGKLETANGGTLFLDEIGEISRNIQVKLLRVLEEREFQRVGDNRTIKLDIRLITASNKDLSKRVMDGSFRDDLFYRLNVFPINLPPLRERIEDIPLLVSHFVDKFNRQMGKCVQGIADRVLEILEAYHWPGNIRELANAVEHAFVHSKGVLIYPSDLPQHIVRSSGRAGLHRKHPKPQNVLDMVERDLIRGELEAAEWKRSEAARKLGMSRSTLWRKMQKYGLGRLAACSR
ncbi:MAG: sigma 54-interacting transcriptional regulator [Desulfomonilaceae bacterium]|nr:sigma 54-interacting transcriptional regulator [Desulfomonilaceae bacterium]